MPLAKRSQPKPPAISKQVEKRPAKRRKPVIVVLMLLLVAAVGTVWGQLNPQRVATNAAASFQAHLAAERSVNYTLDLKLPAKSTFLKTDPTGQFSKQAATLKGELDLSSMGLPITVPVQLQWNSGKLYFKLDHVDELMAVLAAQSPEALPALAQLTNELEQKWIETTAEERANLPLLGTCRVETEALSQLPKKLNGLGWHQAEPVYRYQTSLDRAAQARLFGKACAQPTNISVEFQVGVITKKLYRLSLSEAHNTSTAKQLSATLHYSNQPLSKTPPKNTVKLSELRQLLETILGRPIEDVL